MYSFKKRYQTKKKKQRPIISQENITRSQSELTVKTSKLLEAQERQVSKLRLVFRFASDWLKQWREFFGPIEKQSEDKPIQYWIIFALVLPLTS